MVFCFNQAMLQKPCIVIQYVIDTTAGWTYCFYGIRFASRDVGNGLEHTGW